MLVTILIGTSLLTLVAVLVLDAWARRDPLLVCPNCRACLARRRHQVIVTRHCPRCAEQVLADLERPPAFAPPLTRVEAEAIVAGRRRTTWRVLLAIVAAYVLLLGTAAGFALLAESGLMNDSLAMSGAAAAMIGLLAVNVWALVRLLKLTRGAITCPRCGGRCPPEWVSKFEGCMWCGQPLVADPSPDGVATAPPEG
jgi:hypothetical protein